MPDDPIVAISGPADWLLLGVERGWCSEPVCGTHDLVPMGPDEAAAFDAGGDPCVTVVRLYDPDDS